MREREREQLKVDEEQFISETAEKKIEVNVRWFQLEIIGGRRKRVSIYRRTYWKFYDFQLICRDEGKEVFRLNDLSAILADDENGTWQYAIEEQSHDRIYKTLPRWNERSEIYLEILAQVEEALTANYSPRGFKEYEQ